MIVGRKGAYRGIHYSSLPSWVIDTAFFLRIKDAGVLDTRFAYYQLLTVDLNRLDSGGAIPSTTRPAFYALPISLPPRGTQCKIAAILSAYEDLIENNNRRIKILEEMAQRIYKEWFVDFRYPGHESVPLVDSTLGPIPQAWSFQHLGKIASIDKGLSYKGKYLTTDGPPMANLKCFQPEGGFRREGTKPYSGPYKESQSVKPGDIIVANTDLTQAGAVIGSPAIIPTRAFAGGGLITHHLFRIRMPNAEIPRSFLFEALRDRRFRAFARGRASGTTVLGFRTQDCADYIILVPPRDILTRFDSCVGGALSMQEALLDINETAADTRDLLLPKLISGEIDVENLDIPIPDEAAA